jgi:small-conductance mechanosensitive channel
MRFAILPSTSWDVGIQYAVLTLTSYLLIGIGLVICLNVIQVQGDQIAYVLSALMVGIGFGLKDIVTNFVSGLILLVERPLKVGDQVEIGTQVGLVETINMRSTTIMTFDHVGVVVPNAELVAQTLVNRSAGAPIVRTKILVGVSYKSDVRQVSRALQEIAESHGLVLKKPTPQVIMDNFGESSLDFTLHFWSRLTDNRMKIGSDLRMAILASFRKSGIEIPFPQRDIHVQGTLLSDPPAPPAAPSSPPVADSPSKEAKQ